MADASTFGGGLDFDTIAGTVPGGALPVSAGAADGGGEGADAPPPPAAGPAAPPVRNAATASPFGAGLVINPPAPDATPLDAAENLLRQRVESATAATSGVKGVIFGILNPEARAHNMQLVQQGAQQLAEIQKQKATLVQNKQEAANLGLAPGEVSDYATREARVLATQAKALKGDLRAFQGLMTVDGKSADAIADQVHEAVAGHLTNAQFAYDKLSNMTTQGEYGAAVRDLQQKGVLKDIEALGFKVPDTLDAFNASKAGEGLALRNARVNLEGLKNKLEARNTYQPMEKKEAESWNGRVQTAGGDLVSNGVWGRNAASGTPGFIVSGMGDPRKLGDGFVLGNNDQRKQLGEEFKLTVPKEALEKFREFNRTYQLATNDKDGKPMDAGKINTNPNIQQGVAEGLAAMLRGGNGGANVGLLKIELAKRGWAQGAIDGLVSNYSGAMNTLFSNANKPYLTETTQRQIRDVMDVLKVANDKMIADHGGDKLAYRAGALGFDTSALGLGKDEFGGALSDALAKGRQDQIDRMMNSHQAIGGGDGVLQVGAQRPGAGAVQGPAGTSPSNQLPGAQPVATPVQQAAGAVTPPSPPPGGPSPAPAAPAKASLPAAPDGGGDGPGPQAPDPVHVQLQGVSGAVQQWLTDKGVPPGPGMQKQVDKVLTNPRIEKALEDGKPIDGKTVAAALGKGGDKETVSKLTQFLNAQPNTDAETFSDENKKNMTENAAAAAPAVGGTLGAIGGATVGGPAGGFMGGAAGGAAGQMAQSYLRGEDQDPKAIAKEAALSGVLGVVSAGRPVAAFATRTLGAGAVEAGAAALEGKDGADVAEAGMKGAGAAVVGEAFGRALGMAGHKIFSKFSGDAKVELEQAAKTYSEARQTLETTEAKVAGPGGTGSIDNPKYVEAEKAAAKAETTIKDAGLKPEDAEYAYKVAQEKVPTGEAQMAKPGKLEEDRLGQRYAQMREDVNNAGVGAPKASPRLDNGPVSVAAAAKMPPAMQNEASRVEMAITSPAKDWGGKWQQLQTERSRLLGLERDALGSTSPHKQRIADDYRRLADAVRTQQEKAAQYVFGKEGGEQFIANLKDVDQKYAVLMKATNGGDMERAARMTGEKGRDADKAFRAFAGDDKDAIAAWDALRTAIKAHGKIEGDVKTLVGMERIPYLGSVVSAVKMLGTLKEWRAAKAANGHADFGSMLGLKAPSSKGARDVGGVAATNVSVRASQ